MYRRIMTVLFVMLMIIASVHSATAGQPKDSFDDPEWMVDINPMMPVLPIYIVRVARSVSENGWLSVGIAYQELELPAGTTASQTVTLGYRHFFEHGWNVELEAWPAWDDFKSSVDGETYSGWEIFVAVRGGWMWVIPKWEDRFFINMQLELGYGAYNSNPWPDLNRGPAFFPVITVGYRW